MPPMAVIVTPEEFLQALATGSEAVRTGDVPYPAFELTDGRILDDAQGEDLRQRGLIAVDDSPAANRHRLKVELTEAGRQYVSSLA